MQYKLFLPLLISLAIYGMEEPLQFEPFSPPLPKPLEIVRAEKPQPEAAVISQAQEKPPDTIQQAHHAWSEYFWRQQVPQGPLVFGRAMVTPPVMVSALTQQLRSQQQSTDK